MKTDIQARGFNLTKAIRAYTERRIFFAVSFAQHYVQHITVRLSDINGPRGGQDKRCQLVLKLNGAPSLVIEDTEDNLYAAIDRAVRRASQSVARNLGRKQDHKQNHRDRHLSMFSSGSMEIKPQT